jgi:hypothetical protein
MTLSEMRELQQSQLFDVTALVAEVGEPRAAGDTGRVVRDIKLIDQSVAGDKVPEIKFGVPSWSGPQDSATIDILRQSAGANGPLTFFALSGKTSGGQLAITNARNCFVVKAAGDRASEPIADADRLHATPNQDREILARDNWRNRMDHKEM